VSDIGKTGKGVNYEYCIMDRIGIAGFGVSDGWGHEGDDAQGKGG
jgi:hypothetical protein